MDGRVVRVTWTVDRARAISSRCGFDASGAVQAAGALGAAANRVNTAPCVSSPCDWAKAVAAGVAHNIATTTVVDAQARFHRPGPQPSWADVRFGFVFCRIIGTGSIPANPGSCTQSKSKDR